MNSTIDNLNFAVIIDDTEFNKQIKKMEDEAKRFNTSMSNLLDLKKQAQQWSQKEVENNRRAWQAKVDEERAQEKINKEKIKTEGLQRKINAQIDQATNGYKAQSRILNEIKTAVLGYLSIQSAGKLLSSLVRVTGEFELQKTTLAAMLGDLSSAEQIITRIQGLAVESPFQFKELTTYAKQLSAFSVPAQELYDTTKMLADISAGLGVGMDRFVLAYGQVRSAAFLRGQEVRQFTEAGIPILDELAKQFSELEGRVVSTTEVFDKISSRLVPFEMVAKVFKDMTSEGGKFYNMQEIQAETLRGKISNLKDAYEVMLNEIGSGQTEKMKDVVDWARKLMTNYEETGRTLASLVVSYGVYKTTLVAIELMTRSFSVANHKLLSSLKSIGTWMLSNPYALLAAGITAAGLATYRLATHMSDVERIQKSVADSHEDYTKALASEYSMLESLYAKLELYTEGTLEHDKAKAQIMQKYAPYIEQLRQEGKEVSDLADIYVDLADKIRESTLVRFYDSAMQDLDQVYKDAQEKSQKMLENSIKANQKEYKFTEKDKLALNLYVMGGYDQEKAFEKLSDSAKQYFNDFNVFLNKQRDNMSAAQKAYLEGIDDISDAYQTFQGEVEKTPEQLSKFAETVQNELAKFGATKDNKGKFAALWADNMTEYYAYLKKIREEYEEVQQKIKDVGTTQKANLPDLKKQKEAIEAIAKALGISLDKGEYGKGKSKAQLELESQIDLVKKLQDAYEKLLPFLNDSQMKDTLKNLFPEAKAEWLDSFDFSEVLKKLADDLDKYDDEAAKRLRASVGKDVASSLASAFKEIETYKKMLDEWLEQDFSLEGEGISFDISKIIQNLNNQYAKVDQKRLKAQELLKKAQLGDEESLKIVREVYGEEVWQKYLENGVSVINELAQKEKNAARQTANEKIRDLAKKYVDEVYGEDINLSDWGDKNLSQVRNLGNTLKKLYDDIEKSGLNLSESQKNALDSLGLTTDELIKEIKKIISGDYEETTVEQFKKIQDKAKEVVSTLDGVAGAISSLGEASNSDFLIGLGEAVDSARELTDIITDCDALWENMAENSKEIVDGVKNVAQSSDWITMIIKVILLGVEKIASSIAATSQFLKFQNELWAEYASISRDVKIDNYLSLFDTIFGKDALGELRANANIARGIIEEVISLSKTARTSSGKSVFGWLETDPGWWDRTFSGGGNIEKFDLSQLIDEKGLLSDEGFKKLQAFYDLGDLDDANKARAEKLLDYYEKYKEATESIAESISNIFNSLATDIADNMINSFLEIGDATDNLAKSFDNVRESIGKMILQSALVSQMQPYIEEIKGIFDAYMLTGDTTKFAKDIDAALSGLAIMLDDGKWTELAQVLQDNNLLGAAESTTEMSEGIKGITEATANLLASYLNAIRADVSYSKTLWVRMDANLQRIAEMFTSSPSLMEYQAQIAANTYNTALATQEILSELRSVVTTETGSSSIRVYKDN